MGSKLILKKYNAFDSSYNITNESILLKVTNAISHYAGIILAVFCYIFLSTECLFSNYVSSWPVFFDLNSISSNYRVFLSSTFLFHFQVHTYWENPLVPEL